MARSSQKIAAIAAAATAGIAAVSALSVAVIGSYFVDYALVPGKEGKVGRFRGLDDASAQQVFGTRIDEARSRIEGNLSRLAEARDAWLSGISVEEVTIKSPDGRFDLAGYIYPSHVPSDKWAVLAHGYSGIHDDVLGMGRYYAEQGYNVLAPDMRCHGKSQGDFIGMGWLDRLDILAWCTYLTERYGEGIGIVLHGHSMGGAAVLMASGEEVPDQLVAIVSDCAYTDVESMFADQLRKVFNLPPFPFIQDAGVMLRIRGGYDMREASAVRQVAKSKTPTLFFHGSEDRFVPTEMAYPLYGACAAPLKELHVIEGAGHVESFRIDPDYYFGVVFSFIQKADAISQGPRSHQTQKEGAYCRT